MIDTVLDRVENKATNTQVDRDELFGRYDQLPEAKWIAEGIVMEGGITILAGEYGVGKSTLVMQMIDTFNRRKQLFDLETNPVKTLLVEQDESHYVMGNHIRRLLPVLPTLKDLEYPKKQLRWDTITDRLNIDDLENFISAYPAGLVVIDSLTSIGLPDINHPSMGDLFDQLRAVVNTTKVSILILHHLNRRGEILGSIQIWNKPDNVLELQSDGLIFYKVRGNTPHIKDIKKIRSNKKERTLPFYPLCRDKQTLVFDRPVDQYIKDMYKKGLGKSKIISSVKITHKLSQDAARKRVERVLDKI